MAKSTMTQDEKKWQAESDAHTLAEAQRITEDASRLNAAKQVATKMAADAVKQANQLQKISKIPAAKKVAKKKPAPKRNSAARRRS